MKVHVTSAPFVAVDRAELRSPGAARSSRSLSVVARSEATASGAIEADVTFTVRAAADDAFVVIVSGTSPDEADVLG